MPIIANAKKALRRDRRRTITNKKIRKKIKAVVKLARQKPNQKTLRQAARFLDRAAKKKVIHQNKANRLKSRLAKASLQHR